MEGNPYATPGAALDLPPTAVESAPPMWNPDAAGLWSLLLSPIFGSSLVWRNWIALQERSKANLALIWLAFSVIALLFALLVSGKITIPYIIVWYFACQRPQTIYIKQRWGTAYPRKPWLFLVLGSLGALLLLGFAIGFVAQMESL